VQNNIFKLVKILQVSDLYQLNMAKFMYKYNANILPSSFDNYFFKTVQHVWSWQRQQVLRKFSS